MTAAALESAEVESFRSVVARDFGLQFDDAKLAFLDDVLRRRVEALHCSREDYLARQATRLDHQEMRALARELTVGETYFFRNVEQFHALAQLALPRRIRRSATPRQLRILSAGCATGEEPYSLAIVVRENLADPAWQPSIVGIDVNPTAIKKARLARYTPWSLRETPPAIRDRWFRSDEGTMRLDDSIRESVQLLERNLADEDDEIWRAESCDVIFLRNVVMYMTTEFARKLIARVTRALAPGGFLFLGHAETLRGLSNDFHLHHTHGTFYYERKSRHGDPAPQRDPPPGVTVAPLVAPRSDLVAPTDSWYTAICRSSERVQALATAPRPSAPDSSERTQRSTVAASARRRDLTSILELLRHERFDEALTCIEALPHEAASELDVLVLHAVLLTHSGRFERARDVCLRLLAMDALNSGAHYLLALCHENAGERGAAVEHDQTACYLDRSFAMPHLHLGLLARRSGDRDAALRELTQALELLEREESSRLLLFGGGFRREALLTLCRAVMVACGGTS